MNQPIQVVVNGKSYEVEVGDLTASPVTVTVNGKAYQVEIETTSGTAPQPKIEAVAPPVVTPVPVVAPKPVAMPTQPPTNGGSGNEIRSPMPGVILDIAVKAGDKVVSGQQLCALEAMKMKSAIRSPRDGAIASVEVSDGQRVAFGDVIIRFA